MYISENCNWIPYGTDPELDKKVDSDYWGIRYDVAEQGYGLDKLVYDEDYEVREVVAEQGYGLDILVNDKDYNVRMKVAYQGYGLDKLFGDINRFVHGAVDEYLENLTLLEWWNENIDKHYYESFQDIVSEAQLAIRDFIFMINDSKTLAVNESEIDDFFDSNNTETEFIIFTADTKLPIIKLKKVVKDENVSFKFIVDITNEQDDNFSIKSTIQSKEHLSNLIQQTIYALNSYQQFVKYADELEECL